MKMNRVITFLFVLQMLICFFSATLSYYWESNWGVSMWYLGSLIRNYSPTIEAIKNFFIYFVLLSWIIPLSLFVSLEIVKVIQGFFIEWDINMALDSENIDETGSKVRNNGLNDELGLVKYIFSDKTGTLTENEMEFKKASIAGRIYSTKQIVSALNRQKDQGKWKEVEIKDSDKEEENIEDNKECLDEQKTKSILTDFLLNMSLCHQVIIDYIPEEENETDENEEKSEEIGSIANLLPTLGLNLNKEPNLVEIKDDPKDKENKAEKEDPMKLIYKGPSPDEEALVKASRNVGYILKQIKPNEIILSINDEIVEFEILRKLEFSGDRKRMSVVVRGSDGKIILYTKGADSVMLEKLSKNNEDYEFLQEMTKKHLDLFSSEGLRTLTFTKKELTVEEYENWNSKCKEAEKNIEKRQEKLEKLYEELEIDLELLGCTAIEDKLQEGVPETIEFILNAGINLWVITGDKQETAISIGRSSNLIPKNSKILKINSENEQEVESMMKDFLYGNISEKKENFPGSSILTTKLMENDKIEDDDSIKKNITLVTNGNTLKIILKNKETRELFLGLVKNCNSVICSRVPPLIKALIVKFVRSYSKEVCLSVGDGANDVSMIQEASIGVGLFGKEGTQAARSADYSIRKFSHLKRLLFVHGRYSLLRNTTLIHYSIYKNSCFALGQYWFSLYCGFSGQRIYNDWMMLFFNILFTSVPTIFAALFEKDLTEDILEKNPELYKRLKTGYLFNYKTTFFWFMNAMWHSLVIFFLSFFLFQNDSISFSGKTSGIWTIGFMVQTFAVVIVLLRLAIETKYWVTPVHLAIEGSIFLYFLILTIQSLMYKLFPDEYYVFEFTASTSVFYLMLVLIIVSSLILDIVYKFVQRTYYPLNWHILQEQKLNNATQDENSPLLSQI